MQLLFSCVIFYSPPSIPSSGSLGPQRSLDDIKARPICQLRKQKFRSAASVSMQRYSAMKTSRRLFGLLAPFLAQTQERVGPAVLPSRTFRFEDLPMHRNGSIAVRQILKGSNRTGYIIDLHESDLGPGEMPHPPHNHRHEEMLLINEGQIDITISGKTTRLTPGSVAYIASGEHHGWKNSGSTVARYFVLALGNHD
jgi:mannose-6-phosphate isomerase-like protein (cupin superfamily)